MRVGMLGAEATLNGCPPIAFWTRQKYSRRIVESERIGDSNTGMASYCVVTSGGSVFGLIDSDTIFGGAAVDNEQKRVVRGEYLRG